MGDILGFMDILESFEFVTQARMKEKMNRNFEKRHLGDLVFVINRDKSRFLLPRWVKRHPGLGNFVGERFSFDGRELDRSEQPIEGPLIILHPIMA